MRTAKEAAQAFKAKSHNRVGYCLAECQAIYRSGHRYPSAIAQWNASNRKHRGDRTPPVGAPVFWRGGRYGHIGIYVGNGMVRSTDAAGAGRMGTVPLDWFKRHWGYDYLGWTGDIAGRPIVMSKRFDVYHARLKPGVDGSASVAYLRRALIKRRFLKVSAPFSVDRPGNRYTPKVADAVRKWQRRAGHRPTGVLTRAQARQFFRPNKNINLHL